MHGTAMPDDELDWDDLRYLARAVKAGTLAGAARALRVEHTTIGRRLAALERALGAALVVRGPDGLKLTPMGTKLMPLVNELERNVTAIQKLASAERERVRLALPSGFTRLFVEGLPKLCEAHPDLCLELVSGARSVDLRSGEADLALRSGPLDDRELMARKLCDAGFALYAAQSYIARWPQGITIASLSGHDVIGFDPALSATAPAQWLDAHAVGAAIVLRSREMTDMLAAAESGLGLAVLPCLLGDAAESLIRVGDGVVASRGLLLVHRREARLSKNVRTVIHFVETTIRSHADQISGRKRG
jgi:DNA-binding transcriptional LysR family regulator